jgi:hypothetical protein
MKRLCFPLLFALLTVSLFSCQREIDFDTPTSGGGGTNPGGPALDGYQPLTTGSWWKYKDSTTGSFSTLTMLSSTRTMNGILYTDVKAESGSQVDSAHEASPRPNYYFNVKGFSPNTGAPYDLTFHYLNDTASVGSSWDYTGGQGNGFTALMHTTVIEKNISVTIEGKTYTNVIHTQTELSYDLLGTVMDFATYDYYFAKGIGTIRIRAELDAFGTTLSTCSNLLDYHLN